MKTSLHPLWRSLSWTILNAFSVSGSVETLPLYFGSTGTLATILRPVASKIPPAAFSSKNASVPAFG